MNNILEIIGLTKVFNIKKGFIKKTNHSVHAVSDVSFSLTKGETLGVVGESGCGKSTTARLIMGLTEADSGEALFENKQVDFDNRSLRTFRRNVQMVFQDSSASLNPRLTLAQSIMFAPIQHGSSKTEASDIANDLLSKVGLEPSRYAKRYPHEVSGGQRQRVNIARALALLPKVVIFDEAVSALDKSVEAQVLNLLIDLKKEFDLSYIFISHDLNVVNYISDKVMVMYLGQVVETGKTEDVFKSPAHPYTKALLASMPSQDPLNRTMTVPITGDPPSPIDLPKGCRFAPRCKFAEERCHLQQPKPQNINQDGHTAACFLAYPAMSGSVALELNHE